jgi:hypothetical protein
LSRIAFDRLLNWQFLTVLADRVPAVRQAGGFRRAGECPQSALTIALEP